MQKLPVSSAPRAGRAATTTRHAIALLLSAALMLSVTVLGTGTASADSAPADPANPATPTTVTADALPTVQIDGVAWKQLVVGNTVYVAGSFSTARPAGAAPGVDTVVRNNILAYDLSTGVLIDSFAPSLNAQAMSLASSPDGSRIYVGGQFTAVNGATVWRFATLDAVTGALLTDFLPKMGSTVYSIAVTDTTIYMGGLFKAVGSATRNQLAAFNSSDGTLLDWAPSAVGGRVNALVVSPDKSKVVVGGQFTSLNKSSNPGYGLGAVDAVSGALLPFAANSLIRNAAANASITSLAADGDQVYGTGFTFGGGGNLEGAFSANFSDGAIKWIEDCHGDTYDVYAGSDAVYIAGHPHYCGNIGGFPQTEPWSFQRGLAFSKAVTGTITKDPHGYFNFAGNPRPSLLTWFPDLDTGTVTGQNQGPWAVTGNSNGDYIVMGGEFRTVNNAGQQGLVRFGKSTVAPNDQGPRLSGARINPTLSSTTGTSVRVAWQANHDRDNEDLTYEVIRDGNIAAPVFTTKATSTFWNRPAMGYVDTGLLPNTSYRYRIFVRDAFGNEVRSDTVTITTGAEGAASAYASKVAADGASNLWRLGEASGATAFDSIGWSDLTVGSGVRRGTTGALKDDSNTASSFGGSSSGTASTGTAAPAPASYTAEAWFKTSSLLGGKILGYGNAKTGSSASNDRHVYVDNAGRLRYGVYQDNSTKTIASSARVNDNKWHHVVTSLGADGTKLYLDGVLVASDSNVTRGQDFSGYWRVGGDNLSGWPSKPLSNNLNGVIDEVAIYPSVLSAATVASHYSIGISGPPPNQAPVAAFSPTVTNLTAGFDAAASADPDGSIASYSWDFGDGTPAGSGVTASHSYAAAGSYQVKLTVTDNQGATGVVTVPVTTTAPPANQPPVAAFAQTVTDLSVAFDAAASADPDGSIAAYSWDFGDGTPAGNGSTATHSYAAAGSYQVTLTVTDNNGDTGTLTQPVTVTAPADGVLAADAFERTQSGGWGSAETGGVWTLSGGAAAFSVGADGGAIMVNRAGSGPAAYLNTLFASSTDTSVQFSLDKIANGGGAYASVAGRSIAGTGDYRAKIKVAADGRLTLYTTKVLGGVETTLKSATVPGVLAAGEVLNVRLQVVGTAPTTISAKVWRSGAAEPAAWSLTGTDDTAALQGAGGIGLLSYVSGSSTNVPLSVRFDSLSVRTP